MNAPELHGSGAFVQSSCITERELVAMAAPHKRIAFYQKVLAMLCCCVVALGFVQPPRAHAIAVVDDAYMLVAAYLDACGLSWSLTGVDDKEEFAQAVADMVTSYTGTIGTTVTDWMTTITQASVVGGKLYLSKAQIGQLSAFANWLIGDKGITAGGASVPVLSGDYRLKLADGSYFSLGFGDHSTHDVNLDGASQISSGLNVVFENNASIKYESSYVYFFDAKGTKIAYYSTSNYNVRLFIWVDDNQIANIGITVGCYIWASIPVSKYGSLLDKRNVSLTPAQAIDVPDTTTMSDDETLAIDVGATSGTLSDVLTKIWESIQAGTMAATKAVVKGGTATGEFTDVNDLGLPSLAAIITTRFPFSIPWDVVRGIKLLAAPAEAPHWSIDFMQSIEHRVGSWDGDTTVDIDMSDFPLIGQVCRWTSTIGFCLLLAAGTKKLSWIGG